MGGNSPHYCGPCGPLLFENMIMMYTGIKYVIFALIATGVNIGTQYISLRLYNGPFSLYIAMAAGTGTGLVVKYILDKKYIFYHQTENISDDFGLFLLYSFMGVFTTLIFWGTELLFHHMIPHDWSKYAGAVTGLTIGYITKFILDKHFVFNKS